MDMQFIEKNFKKYADEMMKIYKKSTAKILNKEDPKKEKTNSKNKTNQQKKQNNKNNTKKK